MKSVVREHFEGGRMHKERGGGCEPPSWKCMPKMVKMRDFMLGLFYHNLKNHNDGNIK